MQEFARSCILRLKAAEDKRAAADATLFDMEAKVNRIASMIFEEKNKNEEVWIIAKWGCGIQRYM